MKSGRNVDSLSLPEQEGRVSAAAVRGEGATAPGSDGAVVTEPRQEASMAESVTRHALNPPRDNFQFLLCGIDTLDLGLYVSWDANWHSVRTNLDRKKQQAQGTNGLLDESNVGRSFMHLPSGKPPNFRYHLQYLEYHVYIAISDKFGSSPNVYVSLLAEPIHHVGISILLELLEIDLLNFGGTIEQICPSRVDLFADFWLPTPLTLPFIKRHQVSRSRKSRIIMNGEELETYYCGSTCSPIQLRIYDKGKELLKSDKKWFLPIWGLDDPDGVWRVEFQLRRPLLHQYRIKTLGDLWANLATIWEYLTGEWFTLRLPDNDKTERRTIHPWWQAVRECGERLGYLRDTRRSYSCDSVEQINTSLAHVVGRVITIAARKGIKDSKEAIEFVSQLLHMKLDEEKFKTEFMKKTIRLGYRGKLGGVDNE